VNEPVDAGDPLLAAAERRRPHATRTLAAPCTRAAARRGMRPRRLVPSVASARPGIAQGMRGPAARPPGSSRFRHTTSVGTRTSDSRWPSAARAASPDPDPARRGSSRNPM